MAEHCRSCGQALPPEKPPTELRAWFMYDCHLFKRIDTSDRDAVFPQVREVFDEDGSGTVFVRAQPGEKTREDLTLQADWRNNGGKYVVTDDEIVAWIKRFYAAAEALAPGVMASPATKPTLICPRCKVDRFTEPCPGPYSLCPIRGEAQGGTSGVAIPLKGKAE